MAAHRERLRKIERGQGQEGRGAMTDVARERPGRGRIDGAVDAHQSGLVHLSEDSALTFRHFVGEVSEAPASLAGGILVIGGCKFDNDVRGAAFEQHVLRRLSVECDGRCRRERVVGGAVRGDRRWTG